MDISPNKIWLPKEWESYANKLLSERYTYADYIPIPDKDQGDGGIEGFSLDGIAYQMYCPEDAHTTQKIYDKQRKKMTTDIDKFIKNKDGKLAKIFGSTKIRRWVLVVPEHCTKDMVMHASKKTDEVIASNLSYVDNDDFRVLVWDRSSFEKEEMSLLKSGVSVLKLDPINIQENQVSSFCEGEPEYFGNVKKKLLKLDDNEERIERTRDNLIKKAIISQNMISNLKENYGDYYEQIQSQISEREEELDLEYFDVDAQNQSLMKQMKILHGNLENNCKLHDDNLKLIAHGAIADWLMRCPLDFK